MDLTSLNYIKKLINIKNFKNILHNNYINNILHLILLYFSLYKYKYQHLCNINSKNIIYNKNNTDSKIYYILSYLTIILTKDYSDYLKIELYFIYILNIPKIHKFISDYKLSLEYLMYTILWIYKNYINLSIKKIFIDTVNLLYEEKKLILLHVIISLILLIISLKPFNTFKLYNPLYKEITRKSIHFIIFGSLLLFRESIFHLFCLYSLILMIFSLYFPNLSFKFFKGFLRKTKMSTFDVKKLKIIVVEHIILIKIYLLLYKLFNTEKNNLKKFNSFENFIVTGILITVYDSAASIFGSIYKIIMYNYFNIVILGRTYFGTISGIFLSLIGHNIFLTNLRYRDFKNFLKYLIFYTLGGIIEYNCNINDNIIFCAYGIVYFYVINIFI